MTHPLGSPYVRDQVSLRAVTLNENPTYTLEELERAVTHDPMKYPMAD